MMSQNSKEFNGEQELIERLPDASIYRVFTSPRTSVLDFRGMNLSWILYVANSELKNKGGFIPSLPQSMQFLQTVDDSNMFCGGGFTTNSEEYVAKTVSGNPVGLVVHGGGIFSSPGRISKAQKEGLTKTGGGRISEREVRNLLEGRIVDENETHQIPIFTIKDLLSGIHLPKRYGVVLDYSEIENLPTENQHIDQISEHPLYLAWAGSVEKGRGYLKHSLQRKQRNLDNEVDPNYPDKRVVDLGLLKLVFDYEITFPFTTSIDTVLKQLDPGKPEGIFIRLSSSIPNDSYGFSYGASILGLTSESGEIYWQLKRQNNIKVVKN